MIMSGNNNASKQMTHILLLQMMMPYMYLARITMPQVTIAQIDVRLMTMAQWKLIKIRLCFKWWCLTYNDADLMLQMMMPSVTLAQISTPQLTIAQTDVLLVRMAQWRLIKTKLCLEWLCLKCNDTDLRIQMMMPFMYLARITTPQLTKAQTDVLLMTMPH